MEIIAMTNNLTIDNRQEREYINMEATDKPLVIVLVGPTASGKTALSIELAKAIGGNIISADSMQVYIGMDIGTAKPTIEERQGIPHYLIDEVYPDEEFNVARYQKLAFRYIDETVQSGRIPILTGGTGLYIQSVVENLDFSDTVTDEDYRKELAMEADRNGNEYIHNLLKEVDPESALRIHPNDRKRIIRALEVYHYTGKTITQLQKESRLRESRYRFIQFGLEMEREKLYRRIDLRVDKMLDAGLVDEVRGLMDKGYDLNLTSMQGLGYKEIIRYLKGEWTYEDAVYILKRDTRHYAKRQLTWFRRDKRIQWLNADLNVNRLIENIYNNIEFNGIVR